MAACVHGCMDERRCPGAMVSIPGGDFVMGSDDTEGETDERPERTVTLEPFSIDMFEVTNAEYEECVTAGACTEPLYIYSETRATYYGNTNYSYYPVLYVNWFQAADYCRFRDKRLPSEAEWERAARGPAPSERTYPWGDDTPNCTMANYSSCLGDTDEIGSYKAGATDEGVFDLAGNVYEWTNDWFDSNYYAQGEVDNPLGPDTGTSRATRGGAHTSSTTYIRSANRSYDSPGDAVDYTGIRCAKSPANVDHDQDSYTSAQGDCDDGNPLINPGATEACDDGLDNDCDGGIDNDPICSLFIFNDTDYPIPDDNTAWTSSPIDVTEDRTLTTFQVHVQITHTYIGDLQVQVRHPDGSVSMLHDQTGADVDNINQYYDVSDFTTKSSLGTWYLDVRDMMGGDTGTLTYWSLTIP
jgi:formylglycine-generating enzyme required for sulfatase activity